MAHVITSKCSPQKLITTCKNCQHIVGLRTIISYFEMAVSLHGKTHPPVTRINEIVSQLGKPRSITVPAIYRESIIVHRPARTINVDELQ